MIKALFRINPDETQWLAREDNNQPRLEAIHFNKTQRRLDLIPIRNVKIQGAVCTVVCSSHKRPIIYTSSSKRQILIIFGSTCTLP